MRASRRFEGHIWIERFISEGDTDPPTVEIGDDQRATSDIHVLVDEFGLYCLLDQQGGWYTLRCYPRDDAGLHGMPQVAARYEGRTVHFVASMAVQDYRTYMADPSSAMLSAREVTRWVG